MPERPELQHLAVCADGNRRWAKRTRSTLDESYSAAVRRIPGVIEVCRTRRIPYLSLQVFNRSNWARERSEIDAAMRAVVLLCRLLETAVERQQINVHWVGARSRVPGEVREALEPLHQTVVSNPAVTVSLYVDYDPVEHIAAAARHSELMSELEPCGVPPVDLFVRTTREFRTSGFDPLRLVSAELLFLDGGVPEFDQAAAHGAVDWYQSRNRTFGT